MKKTLLLKTMLLLFGLIVGSSSVWADDILTLDCAEPAPTGSTSTALSSTSDIATFLNSAAGLSTAENKITCSAKSGDVYKGKGSGGGDIPQKCLKVGKASGGGSFTFTIPNTYDEIDEVEITCYGWKTTSSISINSGTAQTFSTAQVETTKTFELANSTRTIAISVTSSAVCVTSIVLKKKVTSSVATPTFSPVGGSYTSTQSVTLACETEGADIYYTLDGSTPTGSSTKYSDPISVSETKTIKAIAIKGSDASNVATATYTIYPVTHAGTAEDPYTVIDARNALTAGTIDVETEYYVKGYISQIGTLNNNGQLTYWLSDDGNMTSTIQCYKGKFIDGADFEDETDLEVGDFATVKGKLKIYGTSTYEFDENNEVVSITGRTKVNISTFTATTPTIVIGESTETTVTNDQAGWTPVSYTYESDDTDIATVDANGVVTAVAKGTANITVTANVAADDANYKAGESKSVEITVTNPFHNVIFSVNGIAGAPTPTEEGAAVTFPANPADLGGKTFVGWTATAIDGTTDEAPTFVTSATMGTSDQTYYAVFATASGSMTTATLTESEIKTKFTNAAMAYNDDPKSYSDTSDGVTWTVKGYATKDVPWVQLRKNATVAYMKISASNNISNIKFTITNTTVPTGQSTSDINNHGAFGGYIVLLDSPEANATQESDGVLGYTNSVSSNVANVAPTSSVNEVYVQVTAAARIWGVEVTCGSSSYSDYCTTVTAIPVTIPANKEWITFCSTANLDFSEAIEGLKGAYTITAHADKAITLTATEMTGKVKAGTGLLLRAAAVDNTNDQVINIPVAATGEEQADNMLKGVTVDTEVQKTDGSYTNLGLSNGEFHPYSAAGTLAAGKAYLQVPTAQMPTGGNNARLYIVLDGEATGINAIENSELRIENLDAPMYNLAGQRVTKSYKGVVIVNGKKYINK